MLPYEKTKKNARDVPLAGAILGSYSNEFVPSLDITVPKDSTNLFRTISKAWRSSFSTMHKNTEKFVHDSQIVVTDDTGLSSMIKAINSLQVAPAMKVMLHKIVNNALYIGKVAHDYLVKCKYSNDGTDVEVMSPNCPYSAYTFQRDFVPKHRKIQVVQEATYDWILWNSRVARHLWRECKTISHAITP